MGRVTSRRPLSSADRRGRAVTTWALATVLLAISAGCGTHATYRSLREEAWRPAEPITDRKPGSLKPLPGATVPRQNPWDGSGELNVETLVSEVLARNPSLAAMRASWQAAVERFPQVTALDDPQFSYGLAPETIGNRRLDLGQKFDLSQKLPWPGKLSTHGEMVLREAEAAGEDFEAERLRLTEAAREGFFDWYYVHRAIEINDFNRELLLEFRRIAETRYATGLASKQDALQAEVSHQHLAHRGVVLARMREVALERLNTLLDRPAKAALPPPPRTIRAPRPIAPLDRLESAAIAERPVLEAQRRRIEAREADVHLAELEYFPNLMVTATYNTLWGEEELRPMGGVGINVPIQLERRRAALDEARAKLQQARSLLDQKEAEVRFEVAKAAEELEEQTHVVRLYSTSIVPASQESLAAARSGYEAATNDFLTLIDAERALMLAQLAYEEGLSGYHKALARLERAVGKPVVEDVEETP